MASREQSWIITLWREQHLKSQPPPPPPHTHRSPEVVEINMNVLINVIVPGKDSIIQNDMTTNSLFASFSGLSNHWMSLHPNGPVFDACVAPCRSDTMTCGKHAERPMSRMSAGSPPTLGRLSSARLRIACCLHRLTAPVPPPRLPGSSVRQYNQQLAVCFCHHGGLAAGPTPSDWWDEFIKVYFCFFHIPGRVVMLLLPLCGSGVVHFLFSLPRSSLRPSTRSGLESCMQLLLLALCSNLLTRPWEWLMKSGRRSSNASWGGKRDAYGKLLVGGPNTVQLWDTNPVERETTSLGLNLFWASLTLFTNLEESSSQPQNL